MQAAPPAQTGAQLNGSGKPATGWPSLDDESPKAGGKKRIVVLGSGASALGPGRRRTHAAAAAWPRMHAALLDWMRRGSLLGCSEADPALQRGWASCSTPPLVRSPASGAPPAAGWAAMSFVKAFDESMKDKYELILVSVSRGAVVLLRGREGFQPPLAQAHAGPCRPAAAAAQLLCVHAAAARHVRGHGGGAVHRGARARGDGQQGAGLRGRVGCTARVGCRWLAAVREEVLRLLLLTCNPRLLQLPLPPLPLPPLLPPHCDTHPQGKFFEAKCTDILPESKEIVACFPGGWRRRAWVGRRHAAAAGVPGGAQGLWHAAAARRPSTPGTARRAGCRCACASRPTSPPRPQRERASRRPASARPCRPQQPSPRPLSRRLCPAEDAGFPEACFKVSYDYLVLGVGSVNNTFGIQGVQVCDRGWLGSRGPGV